MGSSDRVLNGSKTKGSTAILLGSEYTQDLADGYAQGYNVQDFGLLSNSMTFKIRSNSGTKRTLEGVDMDTSKFNDDYSPINHTAFDNSGQPGGSVRIPSPNLKGRESERIDHSREQRDLGQTHLYDDGYAFFEAVDTTNGVEIINAVGPQALPSSLVDHSSVSALDGKIEPLETISQIDRSTIDHPYNARGIKAMMGIDNDAYQRSYQIAEGTYSTNNFNPTVPFLDSVEHISTIKSDGTRVDFDIPGAFYQETSKIKPFSDVSGDREHYVNFKVPRGSLSTDIGTGAEFGNTDIKKVLISNSNFTVNNTLQNFDKLTNGGFDFSNDLGTDSLVYGGLLKG